MKLLGFLVALLYFSWLFLFMMSDVTSWHLLVGALFLGVIFYKNREKSDSKVVLDAKNQKRIRFESPLMLPPFENEEIRVVFLKNHSLEFYRKAEGDFVLVKKLQISLSPIPAVLSDFGIVIAGMKSLEVFSIQDFSSLQRLPLLKGESLIFMKRHQNQVFVSTTRGRWIILDKKEFFVVDFFSPAIFHSDDFEMVGTSAGMLFFRIEKDNAIKYQKFYDVNKEVFGMHFFKDGVCLFYFDGGIQFFNFSRKETDGILTDMQVCNVSDSFWHKEFFPPYCYEDSVFWVGRDMILRKYSHQNTVELEKFKVSSLWTRVSSRYYWLFFVSGKKTQVVRLDMKNSALCRYETSENLEVIGMSDSCADFLENNLTRLVWKEDQKEPQPSKFFANQVFYFQELVYLCDEKKLYLQKEGHKELVDDHFLVTPLNWEWQESGFLLVI